MKRDPEFQSLLANNITNTKVANFKEGTLYWVKTLIKITQLKLSINKILKTTTIIYKPSKSLKIKIPYKSWMKISAQLKNFLINKT